MEESSCVFSASRPDEERRRLRRRRGSVSSFSSVSPAFFSSCSFCWCFFCLVLFLSWPTLPSQGADASPHAPSAQPSPLALIRKDGETQGNGEGLQTDISGKSSDTRPLAPLSTAPSSPSPATSSRGVQSPFRFSAEPREFAAWRASGFLFDRTCMRLFLFPEAEQFAVPVLADVSSVSGVSDSVSLPSPSLRGLPVQERESRDGLSAFEEDGLPSSNSSSFPQTRAIVTHLSRTEGAVESLFGLVESWRFTFGVLDRKDVAGDELPSTHLLKSPLLHRQVAVSDEEARDATLRFPPDSTPLITDLLVFADPRVEAATLPPVCEQLRPWEGHHVAALRLQSRLRRVSLLRSLSSHSSSRLSPSSSSPSLASSFSRRLHVPRLSARNWQTHASRCFVIFTFVAGTETPDGRWDRVREAADLAFLAEPVVAATVSVYDEVLKVPASALLTPSLLHPPRRSAEIDGAPPGRRRQARAALAFEGKKENRTRWLVAQEDTACKSDTSEVALKEYAR
ncbi:hypothetical protein TGMAS_366980 [Toxoplasma gondii MAS]|uniref:Uncharacterized protein n=1 Tax=Toxoplasma gondii MAS TaxID=943118 RepID=A0A086QS12_TOXGO|nr:hypothetical protein TGMAS_366980 [Toxoplasma gondii MAS]